MEGIELLLGLWKDWGIQVLVLLSFVLQVLLLILADIRPCKDSGLLDAVVWSAYLLADTTAIYALGHMSLISRSPEHQLMAFWAPFLLLHLGGQDNITAYSIEDNRLWLRHLQNFVIQVLATAYVLYGSSIFARQTMLRLATILMFVVGVLKYGERVWALNCASRGTLSGKNYRSFRGMRVEGTWYHQDTVGDELGLIIAHMGLNVPKHLLKGPLPLVKVWSDRNFTWKETYQAVEMQLSLMYEIFYTKAEVIHTWYGYCIRVISPVCTVAACHLFRRFSEKDGYNRVDVAITYVLLVGAIVLEITSVLRVIFSSWHYRYQVPVRCCHYSVRHIINRFVKLRTFLKSAMRRRGIHIRYWSGSMGQHNFIHMCTHSRGNPSSKIARWMGREDWWNTLTYTSSVPVPANFSELLKRQLLGRWHNDNREESPDHIHNSRGRAALKQWGLYEELAWSVDTELDESILVWNIATHHYLNRYREKYQGSDLAETTKALSNYMIFLLAARPYMLPDNVSRQRYVELCNKVINHLKYSSAEDLFNFIQGHGDALNIESLPGEASGVDGDTLEKNITFDRACQLGAKLIGKELNMQELVEVDMLELITRVWVEMLCYVGYRCRPDSHAKQLSNGGEITTIVALMLEYKKPNLPRFKEEGEVIRSMYH